VDDNFFDFGGHSLQVVQVQNRLRETVGVDVPVLKLFQFPTIRALAKFIGEQAAAPAGGDSFRAKIEERARKRQNAMTIRAAERARGGVLSDGVIHGHECQRANGQHRHHRDGGTFPAGAEPGGVLAEPA
jgi:aryl carrier-like protein